jgi:hypothetical protein
VLLRLAYLGVTNALTLLRLLPMSDRDKDAEILVLRHQITVLQRQLHGDRVRFNPADRAWLAALLHPLPRSVLRHLQLLVRPETVLRWHRDLIARRHARRSRSHRVGRPRTIRSIRLLVLRLARENTAWGYRRIHGELLVLGITVAASTVWEILKDAGIEPARGRTSSTWAAFLRSQAHAIIAADFFETTTLTGATMYVLAVIEHATRRIRILGVTAHPTASWVTQTARNLVMDLEDTGRQVKYLIRDRDGKYPALFDQVLADAGIGVVFSGVRIPPHELDHGTVDPSLSPGTPRPDTDLEPCASAPCPARVRTPPQPTPASPRYRERPPATAVARSDHRTCHADPAQRPPTRPTRRAPPRIRSCRLTSMDGVLGTHSMTAGRGRASEAGTRSWPQIPREPSRVSRMMSAWPACRAVSSIMWSRMPRRLHSTMSGRAQRVSRFVAAAISFDVSMCSR